MIISINTTGQTINFVGLEGHQYSLNTGSMSLYPSFIQQIDNHSMMSPGAIAARQAKVQSQIDFCNNRITYLNTIINATQSIV
jgi:hypothetical protein